MAKHDETAPSPPTFTLAEVKELLQNAGGGLTEAALYRIVDAIARAAPRDPKEGNLSKEQVLKLQEPTTGRDWSEHWVRDQETGDTALLRCVNEGGVRKAQTPLQYVWSKGYLKHQSDGGLVPDGVRITDSPAGEVALASSDKTIAQLLDANVFSQAVTFLMCENYKRNMSEHGWFRSKGILPHHYEPVAQAAE